MESLITRLQTCQVCHAVKIKPRKLSCLHSFCEDCIGAYICSHQGQSSYPCPICRYDTKFTKPSERKTAIEIINTLSPDNLNDKLWKSFEYNKFAPGNIKHKKFCKSHDASVVERFCLKCCEFICWKCHEANAHKQCPVVFLKEREKLEKKSRKENDMVSKEMTTCMEKLNTYRNCLHSKVENMYSGKERKDKEIEDYFIDLRKRVNDNMINQERKTVHLIDKVSSENEYALRKGEVSFNTVCQRLQLKLNLLQHVIGKQNGDSFKYSLVDILCLELEKQIKNASGMIYEQIGTAGCENLSQMIHYNAEIDTNLVQSDLVDIELVESCHANQLASKYSNEQIPNHPGHRVLDVTNDEPRHAQGRTDGAEADGNVTSWGSCGSVADTKTYGAGSVDEREVVHIRRTLRGMSLRRQRLLPPAPPLQTRINRQQGVMRQDAHQENITSGLGDLKFLNKSSIKIPNDTRQPGPVEMASIGNGIFVVADRWNKSIKIIDTKQRDKVDDCLSLDSEPWGVAYTDNAFVVTCPNEKIIIDIKFEKFSNRTLIHQRIKVKTGYASISYYQRYSEFICSVCPPFGDAQVNILTKYGHILHVVKTDQSNKALFSYPRCLSISDSGFISVVDMNVKRTTFLQYDKTSTSVVSSFEGNDEIAIPVSSAVIPRRPLVAVLYKSGALVVFSYEGQVVAIFDDKISYPDPKCIIFGMSVLDSNSAMLCVGHMDGVLTFYLIKEEEPDYCQAVAVTANEIPPPEASMTARQVAPSERMVLNRRREFNMLSEFIINFQGDQRTPCPVGMTCIGLGIFAVADRWNRTIKLVDTKGTEKVFNGVVLDSEPWDLTHLAGYTFVVTCPNEKKLIEMRYDRTSKNIHFNKRITVPLGFAGISYARQRDRFICSVCPPFGYAQVNILSRRGQVLQVVMKDTLDKPFFSYPRSIAVSESGFLAVVDINLKKVLFFRFNEISTSEIRSFKGHEELEVPECCTILSNNELALVLYKSGAMVSFSFEGEVVDVLSGIVTHTFPKCTAVDSRVDELCVGHSDGMVRHFKLV